jgi:hypothetical protein
MNSEEALLESEMARSTQCPPVRRRPGLLCGVLLRVAAPAVAFLALAAGGRAEQIQDAQFRFSLTIPDGFERMPTLPPEKPKWIYGFAKKGPDGARFAIVVEHMGGMLRRERLDRRDVLPGSQARLHTVRWQGFDIDAIEIPEEARGVALATIKAQVPLKPEAIQVTVVGPRDRRDESLALVNQLLAGLRGESNWLGSVAPRDLANSTHYGLLLILAMAAGGIGGFAVLYLLTRMGPRGTLAVLGGAVILVALLMPHSRTREAIATTAAMNLAGILSLGFGLFECFREPKKKPKRTKGRSPAEKIGRPPPPRPGASV